MSDKNKISSKHEHVQFYIEAFNLLLSQDPNSLEWNIDEETEGNKEFQRPRGRYKRKARRSI